MMPRVSEQDEFLLSRLLDNDLTPAEAKALRRRIEAEPDLAQAYARMARLDSLLKGRRADQPRLDWKAFHGRVTGEVERAAELKGSSRVIRLSRWLRIGVPLAAAAAIALVVLLHEPAAPRATGQGGRGTPPPPPPPGELVVTVAQPTEPAPATASPIKPTFKRSQRLAEATWQADAEAEEQPQSYVSSFVPPAPIPLELAEVLLDESPM